MRAAGLWPEAVARLDELVRRFDAPGAALLLADAYLLLAEESVRAGAPGTALPAAAEARRSSPASAGGRPRGGGRRRGGGRPGRRGRAAPAAIVRAA